MTLREGIEKPTDRMQTPSIGNHRSRRLNSRPGSALKPKLNGFLSKKAAAGSVFPLAAKAQHGGTRVTQANQGRWLRGRKTGPTLHSVAFSIPATLVNNERERAAVTIVDGMPAWGERPGVLAFASMESDFNSIQPPFRVCL